MARDFDILDTPVLQFLIPHAIPTSERQTSKLPLSLSLYIYISSTWIGACLWVQAKPKINCLLALSIQKKGNFVKVQVIRFPYQRQNNILTIIDHYKTFPDNLSKTKQHIDSLRSLQNLPWQFICILVVFSRNMCKNGLLKLLTNTFQLNLKM